VGETYFIELTTATSTGYEQLQSFLTLSNTIFQVLSVETTYSTLTAPPSRVPVPNPQLYADGCLWVPDFDSPNYLSCLDAGKAGGTVVSTYQITIISGGGDSVGLEALIYDKSGGSFHYNTDFSDSPGDLVPYDPADSGFQKRFFPDLISMGVSSRLVFTITNPNPVELGGYNFIDNLPAGVQVAATPNASTTCGGIWNPQPGDTSLAFDIDTDMIGANSTCSVIVDVTATADGTYDNVSENLFIGDFDTGLQATDQLVVADQPPPPACVPGTMHSSWTMEPGSTTFPPLPATVYSGDNLDAVASYTALAGGSQFIETADGQPANAWGGTGWSVATEPDNSVGPGPNDPSWFEFELDTTDFSTNPAEPMSISLDMLPTPNGDWASNTNITMNVHVSTDGGATWATVLNNNTVGKTAWNTRSVTFTPGPGTTNVRVNVTGVKAGSEATAAVLLDNLMFTGCGPGTAGTIPDPPGLAKNFSPDPIGAGEVSTLTFTLSNPNAASPDGDLTGIDFTDNLPTGVEVAATPNVSTTCGGTVTASAGSSVITLADAALAANSSCTVSVDVTSSAVGTHVNISDFIYANESGQNNTSTGFATANLTVLAPPVIEKEFDPQLALMPDNLSALVFTVTNPNPFNPITGIAFVDNLPTGLTVASTPNVLVSGGCGGSWAVSATAGATSISFIGGDIAAGDICVVSVDVEGPIGVYDNSSENVSHIVGGVTVQGNNAEARLVIDNPIPGVGLLKQVGLTSDPDGAWSDYLAIELPTDVYYKLTVENIGELPLSNISVTDPTIDISSCTWPASLPVADAGNPLAHIAQCIVGPITVNSAGEIPNTATAGGDSASGPVSDADSATVATVGLIIDKVADRSFFAAAGETINYTFTVTNSGSAILSAPVTISDPLISNATCPAVNTVGNLNNFLEPGEVVVCTGSYVTTSSDVSNGSVDNIAFATVQGFNSETDIESVPLFTANPALTLLKTGTLNDDDGTAGVSAGDTISYAFTVTNTGNVPLTNITLSDPQVTVSGGPIASLAVGASDSTTFTASYVITQADINNGSFTNTATASSDEGASDDDDDMQTLAQNPALSLIKQVTSGSPYANVGDVISYEITAENIGNVTLTAVEITDPGATIGSCVPVQPTVLAPGENLTCSASYTITQADVDAGSFTNTATVTGADPDDALIEASDDAIAESGAVNPAIELIKVADTAGPVNVGDMITYTIVVTNVGNVSLRKV